MTSASVIFEQAEMIVKVKEPHAEERALLREGQILLTYLHLAPDPEPTTDLLTYAAVSIAYEPAKDTHGGLPDLEPMSKATASIEVSASQTALATVTCV